VGIVSLEWYKKDSSTVWVRI